MRQRLVELSDVARSFTYDVLPGSPIEVYADDRFPAWTLASVSRGTPCGDALEASRAGHDFRNVAAAATWIALPLQAPLDAEQNCSALSTRR